MASMIFLPSMRPNLPLASVDYDGPEASGGLSMQHCVTALSCRCDSAGDLYGRIHNIKPRKRSPVVAGFRQAIPIGNVPRRPAKRDCRHKPDNKFGQSFCGLG
jgi:hypothetical protein